MTLTTDISIPVPVRVEVHASSAGGFIARNDNLRVAVIGATEDEAVRSFNAGVMELVEFARENGLPLPEPVRSELLQSV